MEMRIDLQDKHVHDLTTGEIKEDIKMLGSKIEARANILDFKKVQKESHETKRKSDALSQLVETLKNELDEVKTNVKKEGEEERTLISEDDVVKIRNLAKKTDNKTQNIEA